MASGVLVLGCGVATRLLRYLSGDDKRYLGSLTLGTATDSLDAEGAVVAEATVPAGLDRQHVDSVARRFVGCFDQEVPLVSAVKRGGEALYRKARRGEAVEAPVRSVVVHRLEVLRVEGDRVDFDVSCAKGFYVRSLARDLAIALGTVGHLSSLRRMSSGAYDLEAAIPMAWLRSAADDAAVRERIAQQVIPLEASVAGMPSLHVDAEGADDLQHGRPTPLVHVVAPAGAALPPSGTDPLAVFNEAGLLIALARREEDLLRVVRGFPPR